LGFHQQRKKGKKENKKKEKKEEGGNCELILSLARTSCRLLFHARPTARSLAALRDVVRSRNPSKSTLDHDAVATAVL